MKIFKRIVRKIIMGIDEIKITQKITKDFISKLVKDSLRKKFGYDVDIQFGDIMIIQDDDKAHVDLTVSANIGRDELMKVLKANDLV